MKSGGAGVGGHPRTPPPPPLLNGPACNQSLSDGALRQTLISVCSVSPSPPGNWKASNNVSYYHLYSRFKVFPGEIHWRQSGCEYWDLVGPMLWEIKRLAHLSAAVKTFHAALWRMHVK